MAALSRPQVLPRGRRLQLPGEFARVRNSGQRLACGCLILNWAPAHSTGTRLGVVTSRKLGNAVKRNRARRLMRECFRRHQGVLLQPVNLVLVARNSINGRDFAAVEVDYLKALQRAGLLEAGA